MNYQIEAVFEKESGGALKVADLSEYLYNLKAFYAVVFDEVYRKDVGEEAQPTQIIKAAQSIVKKIKRSDTLVNHVAISGKYNYFRKDLKDEDLFIAKIQKESPLIISFRGIIPILVAALIISGGELELSAIPPKIRVKMPPIADGLKKLREVFKR